MQVSYRGVSHEKVCKASFAGPLACNFVLAPKRLVDAGLQGTIYSITLIEISLWNACEAKFFVLSSNVCNLMPAQPIIKIQQVKR